MSAIINPTLKRFAREAKVDFNTLNRFTSMAKKKKAKAKKKKATKRKKRA